MAKQVGKGTPFTTGQTNTQAVDDRQAAYFADAKERAGFMDSTEKGAAYGTGVEHLTPNLPISYEHPGEQAMSPDGDTRRGTHVKPTKKSPYPGGGW